ncbi:putative isomerase YbhE [Aspergillus steynii IBT 23096]|uniref:Putative isomerase YbhE n=1 Tax=Aspergillus steynii IBT 23096 TaxID=1392250 RepID=A0A2I2GS78_9EURO|nr:putative isomerase YbhE [Aspergillus steynii IBT 23096]PLB55723.1 putative isomerase YbhE [Aspergillus steynii IBT 23096]
MSLRYLPLLCCSLASAANLYATHYSGSVYTLSLEGGDDGYSLSVASDLKTCGPMPSWITLDPESKLLYCSDENGDASSNGSLTSLAIGEDGSLTEAAKTDAAPGGGVNSIIYTGEDGSKYLAIAHYGGSALSTFSLPLDADAEPLQVFHYELTKPGATPQQGASHPHQVILDPSGSFLLSPDLGADQIRVYAIDKSSGSLNDCPSIEFPHGSGPRHGLFEQPEATRFRFQRRAGSQQTLLYTVSEIGGHFKAFDVSHTSDGCLAFRETQSFDPYPGGLPEGATLSGIQSDGTSLYVSIRSDKGFDPNDSMVTLGRSCNGTVAFRDLTSSYGTVPRTFEINEAGDLVAIGNQASSNVAIVKRDPETGKLGDEVASVQVGEPGEVGTAEGLSSLIWGL